MGSLRESHFYFQNYKVFFQEGGEGEPLIFLHPLGASGLLWQQNALSFEKSHSVIIPDFLGFGRSDKPDVPYALTDFVESVIRLLDEKKIERATFIGNSLGGHVSMMLALNYPSRVSRLVLCNPSGLKAFKRWALVPGILLGARLSRHLSIYPNEWAMMMILNMIHGAKRKQAKELSRFYSEYMNGSESVQWKRSFVRTLESIFSTSLDSDVHEIHQPTMILWGKRDRLLGSKGGEILSRKIPGSHLKESPKAGHFPQFEAPEWFNEQLKTFLSDTAEKR